jgi:hypothetical protein
MACSNCSVGLFINDFTTDWLSGNGTTFTSPNGTTVHITSPSSLTVSKGASNLLFDAPSSGQVHFLHWGSANNFLAILTVEGGASGTRTVSLINTAGASLQSHVLLTVLASSSTPLPIVNFCQGDGSVLLTMASDGTSVTNIALWPADTTTGFSLCAAGSLVATMQISGNVTATQLEIRHGGSIIASCPRPAAVCSVSAATVMFPDAVLGPGVAAALSVRTATATISNTGNNCMTIDSISPNAPFTVASTTPPLPATLQVGESLHVNLQFAPTTPPPLPHTYDLNLAININSATPAGGSTSIHCHGLARAAHFTLSFNDPLSFGTVPRSTTPEPTRTLTIQNTGEADITVTVPASASSHYQWTGASQVLHPIAPGNTLAVAVALHTSVEGSFPETFQFTSTASGSPHTVHLNGTICVPRPIIQVPNTGPVNLGNVQQGFRTVRMFRVRNAGNALLQFSARIVAAMPGDPASEAAALLFGLIEDSGTPVTSPLSSFLNQPVDPATACGVVTTGTGEFDFGIAFFANVAPAPVSARLEIFNHNDTTSGAPASFLINLAATVTNPVSVDVELVLDRSGSMADPSGSRVKIETARDAARLFVELSRPDVQDRIGLVRFNTVPENVASIDFITSGNRDAIAGVIDAAHFSPDGGTAIAGGVLKAEDDMSTHPRATIPAALNRVIIVLTDGQDNTPYQNPADSVYYTLLGGDYPAPTPPFSSIHTEALPVPSGIKIYAIGIGDSIDVGRLGTLSTSSGGVFLQAREFSGSDFFNLEKHFTQVYMEAVDYALISDPEFDILPGETHNFEFEVLTGDKSAMVVLYDHTVRLPFMLFTPHGETVDLLSVPPDFSIRPGISPTARFLEVNMPQGEPERYAGTWKVRVQHDRRACFYDDVRGERRFDPENFGPGFQPKGCKEDFNNPVHYGIAIGAGSNFAMIPFVTPGIVHVGEPIQLTAMISEYGLPVRGGTVTVRALRPDGSITTHLLPDDGLHGDDAADDGTYGVSYIHTHEEGTYVFTFTAIGHSRDGKEVKREAIRSKYVEGRQPLVPVNPGNERTRPGISDKCCRLIGLLLLIGLFIGVLILVLLFLIWKSPL